MITTKIIKDSINPRGSRLTTAVLTYPKFIHGEVMTHRVFSRNAASSRAIPTPKLLDILENAPALPEYWGVNQAGMQALRELDPCHLKESQDIWTATRLFCIEAAKKLNSIGLHKQIANRIIEAWMPITVIVTASDVGLGNWFGLRCHEAAQPEIQVLAYSFLSDYIGSQPTQLDWRQWHIPYSDGHAGQCPPIEMDVQTLLKVATARCARISYLNFDGSFSIQSDCDLHDRLASAGHWSPFEHCAQALIEPSEAFRLYPWSNFDTYSPSPEAIHSPWSSGFFKGGARPSGWGQYRKTFPMELREPDGTELNAIFNRMPGWIFSRISQAQAKGDK